MKKNLLLFGILCLILCISCDSNSQEMSQEDLKQVQIIGKWKFQYEGYWSTDTYFHFLEDGNGYKESFKTSNKDNGINRIPFTWNILDSVLTIHYMPIDPYFSKSTKEYTISNISEDLLILNHIKTKDYNTYTRINSEGTTSIRYKSLPYVNYVRINEFYYELSFAEMSCKHAVGTGSNGKFLQFYGSNESLDPIGIIFNYFTPYYEGINKEWSDGTYLIRSSGNHWVYRCFYIWRGASYNGCTGKLHIKTVNNIKIFDFSLDDSDVVGHLEGIWRYSYN